MEVTHGLMHQPIFAPSNPKLPKEKAGYFNCWPQPPSASRVPFQLQPQPPSKAPFLPTSKPIARPPFLPPSKPTVKSPFRRVLSESNADFTLDVVSSPSDEPELVAAVLRPSQEELLRKIPTRSKRTLRKTLQRSMSVAIGTTDRAKAAARSKAKQVEPVPQKKTEMGPWTIEATDLFEWRPPEWEERVKKRQAEFGY